MIELLIVIIICGAAVGVFVLLRRLKRSRSETTLPLASRPELPLDISQHQGHGDRASEIPATQEGVGEPHAKEEKKQPCVVEAPPEKDGTHSTQGLPLDPGQLDDAVEATSMRQDAPGDFVDTGEETQNHWAAAATSPLAAGAPPVPRETLRKWGSTGDAGKNTPKAENVIDPATSIERHTEPTDGSPSKSPADNPPTTKASVVELAPTNEIETEGFTIDAKDEPDSKEVIDPALAEASSSPSDEKPTTPSIGIEARPTAYKPPRPRVRPKANDERNDEARSPTRSDKVRNLPVLVKARIHQNTWSFSLLAQRPNDAPLELEAVSDKNRIQLLDAGDDWYELAGEDLPRWPDGFVLQSTDLIHQLQWQLTARDLHIFGCNTKVAGWSSVARLAIGHKHLLLAKDDRVNEVAAVLQEIDCKDAMPLGREFGAPSGWTIFWPVMPTTAAAPVGNDPLLDLLRPLPDVDITFEDGVRLHGSIWMNDFPPTVRVEGTLTDTDSIFFDGHVAQRRPDGVIVAAGMDTPGLHDVSITGRQSRSYTVVDPVLSTDFWEAYSFAAGSICGAFVKSKQDVQRAIVTIPRSNPLLIGCVPGEVFACPPQPGNNLTILPPFDPVWALPLQPLRSDSRSVGVLNLAMMPPGAQSDSLGPQLTRSGSRQWIQAIKDTARKRLSVTSNDRSVHALWTEYVRTAQNLWRLGRDHR